MKHNGRASVLRFSTWATSERDARMIDGDVVTVRQSASGDPPRHHLRAVSGGSAQRQHLGAAAA